MQDYQIYTIGHSTHQIESFINLLYKYSINCVIDVRSIAASAFNPQFNKDALSKSLSQSNVIYMHFTKEFGARRHDSNLLDDEGKVDFEKVRRDKYFLSGIDRLKNGAKKGFIIALMCSEAEPFDCHRFSLISVFLERECFNVKHILKDGKIKTNAHLEERLLKRYEEKYPDDPVFKHEISLNLKISKAYRLRNKEIAYSPYFKENTEKL